MNLKVIKILFLAKDPSETYKNENFVVLKCVGKTQKCANRMTLRPCPRWLVGCKVIRLDFWAHFLCYFLLA
jgi:hypothetical protein